MDAPSPTSFGHYPLNYNVALLIELRSFVFRKIISHPHIAALDQGTAHTEAACSVRLQALGKSIA
jgi:hypothetical protein